MSIESPLLDPTALLASCVLPGCSTLVAQAGEACDGCRTAFGEMLVLTDRPAMTAEDIDRRDIEVTQAYLDQQALTKHIARDAEGEVRANQICWLCTERHRCTRVDGRWECAECQGVAA